MTINIPCWTTSKEEADKLVDELSEVCFEYGKDESKEKMLDVFYKTKMLKNYVGIMQGRIELLNARIAELEGCIEELKKRIVELNWADRPALVGELKSRIAELEAENNRLAELLHNELSSVEIATDLGNKRWTALNKIYEDGEKHNTNWCKRIAQKGLGIK